MGNREQLDRLIESRDTIRTKMVSLGLSASDDKLDELATAVNGIAVKTSSNMTVSGATVTAPAGYYKTAQSKSVSTATQATPSITVSSTGLITASATQSAGYVSSGTKSNTSQLSTQAATTITPGTSNKTAVAAGKYTTGAVTVKGDANLKEENIMKGVSIFGVAGAAEGGGTVEEITNGAGGRSVYINSEVPKLPEGYTRLKYIESTGTQYVNTGFKPNNNTRVVMDLQGATTTSDVYMHYGVTNFMAGKASSRSWNYYVYYNRQEVEYSTRTASDFTARHTIDQNKNVITTGADTRTLTAETFSSGYNMYLFGVNNNGSLDYASPIRVFSCQIYDNGTMVRDYVPCKNASGTVGLYDMVNGVFYADAAGGAFVAGPVVLDYTLPDGYEELEHIQSSGTQYVDTGFKPNNNTRMVVDFKASVSSTNIPFFGSRDALDLNAFCVFMNNSAYQCDYGTQYRTGVGNVNQERTVFDFNKSQIIVDGNNIFTFAEQSFSGKYPAYLFAVNHGGAPQANGKITGILYSCEIYSGEDLVRYYLPCKNASGEVGLWDAVNNTFTGDAAGVGFIAGPMVGTSVSKVVLEDEVLIDLTGDTVTPESLLSGFTAHNAMGQLIQGAASAGKPVASGTFAQGSLSQSVTVSGLDFKPDAVFLMWNGINRSQSRSILAAACKPASSSLGFAAFLYYSGGYDVFQFGSASTYFVMNSNGFTCKTTSQQYLMGGYNWIAVG